MNNEKRNKHMTLDDRIEIQKGLKEGKSFAEIGSMIARDGSTVSKEVRSHLIIKETGTRSRSYNPCVHRKNCRHDNHRGISTSVLASIGNDINRN